MPKGGAHVLDRNLFKTKQKPTRHPRPTPTQKKSPKTNQNCSFQKYYLRKSKLLFYTFFFLLYKASYFYTSGNTKNSRRRLRTETVVFHHSTIKTRRGATCKSHLLVSFQKRRRKLMFGNDLSLSSGESYHASENASRSQAHGFLVLGQIDVHETWRPFLLPCGLVCCEDVCNFWTYLKTQRKERWQYVKLTVCTTWF